MFHAIPNTREILMESFECYTLFYIIIYVYEAKTLVVSSSPQSHLNNADSIRIIHPFVPFIASFEKKSNFPVSFHGPILLRVREFFASTNTILKRGKFIGCGKFNFKKVIGVSFVFNVML